MAAAARGWVWASDEDNMPSSGDILSALRELMHDDTAASRQANLPFFPLDLLKLVASHLDYAPNIRPVTDLPALLYHPHHPAQLVPERNGLLYLHVWSDARDTYVRGFYTVFHARRTTSGIHHNERAREHSLNIEITDAEWSILGRTEGFAGVLADWVAKEISKDPMLYLGEAGRMLTMPPFAGLETRRQMILAYFVGIKQLAHPAVPHRNNPQSMHSPTCCLEIGADRETQLLDVDVFAAETGELLYYLPKRDRFNGEETVAWQARVRALDLPVPHELVRPFSINDQSCMLLGLRVSGGAGLSFLARVKQVMQVQPAPAPQRRDSKPVCHIPPPSLSRTTQ
jgi:hypothetical protein